MHVTDLRTRARLLRRLGYSEAHVVHRCLGNTEWGFELSGEPPLNNDEIRELVAAVFRR